MNLVSFFCLIFSTCITLSVTNGQGATCDVSNGNPTILNRNLGTFSSDDECLEACKIRRTCLLWKYNRNSTECRIVRFKKNDDNQMSFGINNCQDSTSPPTTCPPTPTCPPPTTIPGLESLLAEVRNLSRVVEDLKEQNENGLNSLNGKLTNVESQNQINYNKFMEKLEANQKLSELSIGMTLAEYEAKETYCSTKGNFLDINTGYCFKYIVLTDTLRTWDVARVACNREGGGELAWIKSRQEWDVVKGLLQASGVHVAWLGGRDEGQGIEGTWVWRDGSPVTFSYWQGGYPTVSNDLTRNCMAVWSPKGYQWFSTLCGFAYHAVCKTRVEA